MIDLFDIRVSLFDYRLYFGLNLELYSPRHASKLVWAAAHSFQGWRYSVFFRLWLVGIGLDLEFP